ncbi:MAG: zinc ABC transporter substrate-binding protein [Geminicoccaceae bacterium]|nr:zinc ABC transporter substrate-binding protein [Geminicoccaceae bacterium]
MRRRSLLHWTAATLVVAARAPAGLPAAPLRLVATTALIADLVGRVAGDRARLQVLVGEGVDPHTYRPTRADIVAMRRADAVFANGFRLEAQLEGFLEELARERLVVRLAERLPEERLLANPTFPGRFDPHVWMEVALWRSLASIVARELARLDPSAERVFFERARDYEAKLERLESYVRDVLATVPREQRVLVTAHDAFGYFGRAYSFEVIGIQGISTESEAGLADIERLVRLVVERRIPAVFVETSVAERNVMAIVEGARARGHRIRIGGRLFSDSLGAPGTYEGTYIGMIDHNVTTIARALGGEAPAGGFQGRLNGIE